MLTYVSVKMLSVLRPVSMKVLALPAMPALAAVRAFHASESVQVRKKHLKRLNRLHKHWAKQMMKPEEEWVDPMLGRQKVPFIIRVKAQLNLANKQIDSLTPEYTAELVHGAEKAFSQRLAVDASTASTAGNADSVNIGDNADEISDSSSELKTKLLDHQSEVQLRQREAVARIVSLQNTNQSQIRHQAISLAVNEFQRAAGDTGSPEVQAAVATIKILFMSTHAKEAKKDVKTKRALEQLVQNRRKILMYLRRENPQRYVWTIEKLGLKDETVCEEFHMSRRYLFKTQFYGDKTLPMPKTNKDTQKARDLAAKRAKADKYLARFNPQALLNRNSSNAV